MDTELSTFGPFDGLMEVERIVGGSSRAIFREPERLGSSSAWWGHVPFAQWLIHTTRPRRVVELGTHYGVSYGAFIGSVKAEGIHCKCSAVDTWAGDVQAGYYDEDVYAELLKWHDGQFDHFSQLHKCTFDEAVHYFADGSIDILHIDGLLTYDAVRHDFETWLPKISDRGVVLLHDIHEYQSGFGVWRLWTELCSRWPSFEFAHGHGLGVLAVGSEVPAAIGLICTRNAPERAARLRYLFAFIGRRWSAEAELASTQQLALSSEQQRQAAELERDSLRETIANLRGQYAHTQGMEDSLRMAIQRYEAAEAALFDACAQHDATLVSLGAKDIVIGDMRTELSRTERQVAEATALKETLRGQLDALQTSTLWQATWPFRRVLEKVPPRFREGGRRAAKLLWWSATLRLGSKLNEARQARRDQARLQADNRKTGLAIDPKARVNVGSKEVTRAVLSAKMQTFLSGSGMIELPSSVRPVISILLVLHDDAELTFGCLASIAECLPNSRAEVIIFDNDSTDSTVDLLARTVGATVMRSPENLHLLRGTNQAAHAATGRYLLLLTNSVQLLPGTVEAALRTLEADPDIGAVGGRIVLPDGTLQEAGSIVWRDGTCTGYGKGRRPTDPEVMFQREVDYCSSAFLLTPRHLFERLGGFDERYSPAYYEDVDYCVRLRQVGWRIVYDPDAVVLRYEFGSWPTFDGALDPYRRNQEIFRKRHLHWLDGQLPFLPENIEIARRAPSSTRHVLMIEDRVPHGRSGFGDLRANQILKELAAVADVTLFPMFGHLEAWREVRCSMPPSVEVLIDKSRDDLRAFLQERQGWYDAIVVCRPHNMRMFLAAGGNDPALTEGARIIYDAEAIFANRKERKPDCSGSPLPPADTERLLHEELQLARQASVVLAVSRVGQRVLESHGIAPVHILGFELPIDPTATIFDDRNEVLFVGAMHDEGSPNANSLRWFAAEVLPALRDRLSSNLRLKVVGYNGSPSIAQLDGKEFDLIGPVEDLKPCFETARLMVAPTRYVTGIPHEIYKAAAFGVPVVASDLLVDQMGWVPGKDLLTASDGTAFADACASLYLDKGLWTRIRDAALERCREDCSPARFRDSVVQIVDTIKARSEVPVRPKMPVPRDYDEWIRRYDTLTSGDRSAIRAHISSFEYRPLISVVVPLDNPPEPWLQRCIEFCTQPALRKLGAVPRGRCLSKTPGHCHMPCLRRRGRSDSLRTQSHQRAYRRRDEYGAQPRQRRLCRISKSL